MAGANHKTAMTAILNQKELIEAVKEWCEKRGLPVPSEVEFLAKLEHAGTRTVISSSDSYKFEAKVLNLDMQKNGPYR